MQRLFKLWMVKMQLRRVNERKKIHKRRFKNIKGGGITKKFEIISNDYYSNCLIEAIKAKIRNPKIRITVVMPWDNEVYCPHILWSDGVNDYDFGNEGKGDQGIKNWTLHKGHIRKRGLGFNDKYKRVCKKWARRHKGRQNE